MPKLACMGFDLVVLVEEGCQGGTLRAGLSAASKVSNTLESLTLVSMGEGPTGVIVSVIGAPQGSASAISVLYAPAESEASHRLAQGIARGTASQIVISSALELALPGWLPALLEHSYPSPESFAYICSSGLPDDLRYNPLEAAMLRFDRERIGLLPPVFASSKAFLMSSLVLALMTSMAPSLVPTVRTERPLSSEPARPPAIQMTTRYFGREPVLSVIVPTLDVASVRLRRLVESLKSHTHLPYQLIIVDNANNPQGFAAPVNSGIRAARTRYVAVVNDDVQVTQGWWMPLQRALEGGEAVVFPQTLEFTRADFSAWCFAMTDQTIAQCAHSNEDFFDPTLSIWFQDSDLYLRLKNKGTPPRLVSESVISHGFSETLRLDDPLLRAWINRQTNTDKENFVHKWGDGVLERIGFRDNLVREVAS